jgi:hypothetical protein
MDRRAVQALADEGLKGMDEEWKDLNGLAKEAQFKVQGLIRAEVRIGMLRGAEEKAARSIRGSEVSGLDAPLRLEEHGVGAGIEVGTNARTGRLQLAYGALKDRAEGSAQHVAANFKRKMEPGSRPQLEEEASDAQRRSGVK